MLGRGLLRAGGGRLAAQCRGWHDVTTPGRHGLATTDHALPRPLRAYLHALHARPRLCAIVGAAGAGAAGDMLAQLLGAALAPPDAEPPSLSARASRTLTHAAFVGALVGGAGDVWFRALAKKFPGHTYEAAVRGILDQALFAPVVLGIFVGAATIAGGSDVPYAQFRLREDWIHPVGKMWSVWLGGGALSYLYAPAAWQPVVACAQALLWNCYISARVHAAKAPPLLRERYMETYLRDARSGQTGGGGSGWAAGDRGQPGHGPGT